MRQLINLMFWNELYEKGMKWVIAEVPSMLILILIVFLAFRLLKFSLNRLKAIILKRSQKNEKNDILEIEKRVNTLIGIVRGTFKIILWSITIMILLKKFGIDIRPILASAGIIGLAIGFGAQELVRDVISGFFILLENQVRVGDVAIINGTGGIVEKIELRTITLRDISGVVHIFQNGKISTLSNMTKGWSAMVFNIGVAYKEDTDTVIGIMKDIGDELQADPEFKDKIIEPIEVMGLDDFADSALVIKARIKTKPVQQWKIGREYRKRLKKAFDKQNIEIPFPHTTVYWGEEIHPLVLNVNKS